MVMKYVPGYGPTSAKLMIIGIAPGSEEVLAGRPFVGPSGAILREDLADANFNLDNAYRTNIFKYQLPENEFKKYQEIGLSLPDAMKELQGEINSIQPNAILGLGNPVLHTLTGNTGINDWRGSILSYSGNKLVCTYHPAAELHGEGEGQWKAWQKYVRKFDISRAVYQSTFKEFKLPQRLLHIISNSSELYRFLERNQYEEYCSLDIESIQQVPICLGMSFRTTEAISIPLWNTLPISHSDTPKKSFNYNLEVSTIPTADLAYIWHILAQFLLNPKIKFIGQNFKYDEDKLNRLGLFLHGLYYDTLIGGHAISSELPRNLGFQTSIYTEEPYYKNEGREFNPKYDKIKDLLLYNCKDAACTLEIYHKHMEEMADIKGCKEGTLSFRMRLHKFYHRMEKVGFKVNEERRLELIQKYVKRLVSLEAEFFEICRSFGYTEPVNIRSVQKQLPFLFYEVMKIPRRKGVGEQVLTALLANSVKDPIKRRALEIRLEYARVDKTIGTYLAAESDYDNRHKTTYFITGTESFRSSTQILKPPLRNREIGWALQTVTKHGDTGNDLRSILVSDRGYIFINIDQSQAEARVCSLLADDEKTLAEYDSIDKHAATAAKFFGGTIDKYSKKVLGYECPERFVGKTLRHAYHLDIGKHEAMINVNTDAKKYNININISEWKAGECLKELYKDTPKIKDVFHATIQELLKHDRRLYGTFGASFYLYEEWGRDLFKAAYSRIPQQTVSDKTKSVGIRIQRDIWDCLVVGEAHDALLLSCPERKADSYIPLIRGWFSEPISFEGCSIPRRDLVIPTDVEVGYDYEDLKKYKIKELIAS